MRLCAADLFRRKLGFERGSIFYATLCDAHKRRELNWRERQRDRLPLEHEVLVRLVETRLLPALPRPLRTQTLHTRHNPIRAESGETLTADIEQISVEIDTEEVIATARQMVAARRFRH